MLYSEKVVKNCKDVDIQIGTSIHLQAFGESSDQG